MSLITNIFRKLHPHYVVATYKSQFSGEVQVVKEFGQLRVWAGGIPQTGGLVQLILKKHLPHFNTPKKLLLLGIGGGGIITEIHKQFPQCHVTAVDIDQVMIDVARKHFQLHESNQLTIVNQDASKFVMQSSKDGQHYDAILLDCFQGIVIPSHLQSQSVIHHLSQLVAPHGVVTFNRTNDKRQKNENDDLISKLKSHFNTVKSIPVYSNLLVVAQS